MKGLSFISFLFFISSCSTLKPAKPLARLNFKEHSWQIVYIEDQNSDTAQYLQNIWLLNNNRIIDSLKREYRCNLNKQGDGEKEYQIYTFKDNQYYNWVCFNSTKNFQIGSLKSNLIPVTAKYIECIDWHSAKITKDSLTSLGIDYTITRTDSVSQDIGEFAIVLDLDINVSSKLFQNDDWIFKTSTPNAKAELTRLFPEWTVEDVSSQSDCSFIPSAPGNLNNVNEYFYRHKPLRYILTPNKASKLDTSKFKNTDLFLSCLIRTRYIITTYSKK